MDDEILILTYVESEELLKGDNLAIQMLIDNLTDYLSVELTCTLNCGNPIVKSYPTESLTDISNEFYVEGDSLLITDTMFGLIGGFVDGVYQVTMKIIGIDSGYEIYSNCLFVDITYKCKVAALLDGIISENQKGGEQTDTIAHMLHYSLVNGSNCGCNCAAMCDNFNALCGILNDASTQINNDCGCW
jgi:hypothetical protein